MAKASSRRSALGALLSEPERAEHARRVQALRARNALLTVLENTREQQGITSARSPSAPASRPQAYGGY